MTDFFKGISPVKFEGPDSTNPLAYRHYNKDEVVLGKRDLRYTRKTGARFVTVRIDRDRGLVQFACAATIASGEMSTRQRECRLLA